MMLSEFINRLEERYFTSFKWSNSKKLIDIYLNPTESEFDKFAPIGARGFIKPDGDLYLEGLNSKSFSSTLHAPFLEAIKVDPFYIENYGHFVLKGEELKYGVSVQRYNNTNKIYLAEIYSNPEWRPSKKVKNYSKKNVEIIFERCKTKNKHLLFISKDNTELMGGI